MPLRDPYSPSFSDPLGRAFMRGMPAMGPPRAQFPELSQEEAEPLKQQLLRRAVSGLSYIGGSLDKALGGRAVRAAANAALFGGSPRDIASVIPFSDTLGITRPQDSVSGEQLLRRAGYHPERGNWLERNLAGPALEIAMDPGTYLSFGAKGGATALGKVLQRGGHVPGWTHRALMQGFEATEPALRAAGRTTEQIAQMAREGTRIASPEAVAAARAAGFTGDLAGRPLSALAGVGLPLRDTLGAFGTGRRAEQIAGAFDVGKEAVKFAPGVRQVRAFLDTAAGRESHAGAQQAFEAGMVPTRDALEAATRYGEHSLRTRFQGVMKAVGQLPGFEPEAMKTIRGLAEGVPQFADPGRAAADLALRHGRGVAPGVADPNAVSAAITAHFPALQGIAGDIRTRGQQMFHEAKAKGLLQQHLSDDSVNYVMRRYIASTPGFQGTDEARFLSTTSGSNLKRSKWLRNIPGGTEQINSWAMDKNLVGPGATALSRQQKIDRIAQDMQRVAAMNAPGGALSPVAQSALQRKAGAVMQWLDTIPHGHATGSVPIPYYSPDVIGDVTSRGLRHARVMGAADALYAGIKGMAQPMASFTNPADAINLWDFLRKHARLDKSGLHFERPLAVEHMNELTIAGFRDRAHAAAVGDVAQHLTPGAAIVPGTLPPGISPAEVAAFHGLGQGLQNRLVQDALHAPSIHAHMALAGRNGISPLAEVFDGMKNAGGEIMQYGLHRRDATALAGMLNNWVTPSEAKPFVQWLASNQNLFKNMVYPMWPASHVRNMVTALYNNFLHGANLGDYLDAMRIQRGMPIVDVSKYAQVAHLSPADAANELGRLAYAHGKVGGGIGSMTERVGARGLDDELLQEGLRGSRRLTPYPALGQPRTTFRDIFTAPGWYNPLHQQGVGGGAFHQGFNKLFRGGAQAMPYADDRFFMLRMGRGLGTRIEDTARLASYLSNLRQGMAPANAGLLTKAIHFDYQDLTQGEQSLLKNVIPFYTFLRKNLPYQLGMAFERPSAISPTLHAIAGASGRDWVPEYLASGSAIPVGQEQEGEQRYLTSLGLPFEEAFSRMKFRNYDVPGLGETTLPSVGSSLLGLAGNLTPALKGPAEYLTDTQFFSGRRLSDLDVHGPTSLWGQIPQEYAQPLAQLLANTPLARLVTTARTWTDPRKSYRDAAINTLTGVRLSDVDIGRQRAIAARKELEAALALDPRIAEFTNYFPKKDAGPLPPDLLTRLRLFTLMKNEAKAAALAREREAAAAAQGPSY